ncbi:hypothetical protein, partial [uncultured Sphingomonas sp.]|uniref:hypothetical protein n=1 Tax=uncultured Sphingomonas sp. TaxID=158754 RepID=UPI0035C9AA4C
MRISFSGLATAGLCSARVVLLGGAAVSATVHAAPQNTTPPQNNSAQSTGVADGRPLEPLPPGDAPVDDIVVTGARASREQAIERKRALPTIADV